MHFFPLRIFVITSIILLFLFHGCEKKVDAWQTAPEFSLKDLSGNMVSLKQYRGYIVLLDFWATWCPPCRQSIPELVDLQEKYRDKGVVILGISMDNPLQFSTRYLRAFKEKFKINYKILRVNRQVALDYFGTQNMAIPTMFVINREGKIVDKHVGFRPGAVEKSIKKLI
jgi:peroxiredoxin